MLQHAAQQALRLADPAAEIQIPERVGGLNHVRNRHELLDHGRNRLQIGAGQGRARAAWIAIHPWHSAALRLSITSTFTSGCLSRSMARAAAGGLVGRADLRAHMDADDLLGALLDQLLVSRQVFAGTRRRRGGRDAGAGQPLQELVAPDGDQVAQHFLPAVEIVGHRLDVQTLQQRLRYAGGAVCQHSDFGHVVPPCSSLVFYTPCPDRAPGTGNQQHVPMFSIFGCRIQ